MVTGPSTTFLTAVKLHEEVDSGAQCAVYVGLHLLLANMKDILKSSCGETVSQIVPICPDQVDTNVVRTLNPIFCSSCDGVPLK